MEAAVVLPVAPAGGRELNVRESLERPGVAYEGADALGLVESVDRRHPRIFVGVADCAD